jgi:calcineurin-like phosphoesterase family protein
MEMNKQIFFTSDWHIGHENSIQFDNRPYRSLDDMHESLIHNFNKVVPEDGLTYFLGDIMAKTGVISRLNGTKVLVIGNHDKPQQNAYNNGFDVVMNGVVLYINKERVTASHCPLIGLKREDLSHIPIERRHGDNWHGEYKNQAFSFENRGQFHVHGHIHSSKETWRTKTAIKGRQFDVGVPAHNYKPVHIGVIESWIAKTLKTEQEIINHTLYQTGEW